LRHRCANSDVHWSPKIIEAWQQLLCTLQLSVMAGSCTYSNSNTQSKHIQKARHMKLLSSMCSKTASFVDTDLGGSELRRWVIALVLTKQIRGLAE
jgi:hypothetical protein